MPLDDISNLTLKEAEEKLQAKQDKLGEVFKEALTDEGVHDFRKVKCLGESIKGSAAVAAEVRKMNDELNAIGEHRDALLAAEKAANDHKAREKAVNRLPFAGPGDGGKSDPDRLTPIKSLGQQVVEAKGYRDWVKAGAAGGVTLQLDDVWPTDALKAASTPRTLGNKALFETTAGWAPESTRIPGFVEAVTRPIQLIDIIPLAQTGQELVVYMEETTRTHAAAEKAEGAAFAESTYVFTEKNTPVVKITDSLPVTDEQLEDVAQAESYINGRLMFGVRQRLDGQALVGNGTPPNLRGIANVVGIQTQAKGADPVPDAFFKAMTKVRVTGRAMPTHNIIHPTDWEGVRLLRTADGLYIWGNPSEAGPERMWGLPIVQQDIGAAGTGYVGSFMPAYISLFERRGIDVQVGYTGTQFTEGKRTVRADMRMALAVFRPAAFASVTGL